MLGLDRLVEKYRARLAGYPFDTPEEARAEGVADFRLREREEFTALETPYTMRQTARAGCVAGADRAAWEEEDSSEAPSSDGDAAPFYDDVVLDIDLFHRGRQIVDDSRLTLVRNEKYGLVGRNGIGKTTLLRALRKRKFGVPRGLRVHTIHQDYVSDERVVDFVGPDGGRVLTGLGFSREMQEATLRELSGGWRMRAQLARAIHLAPDLLLLDEPTNFLDINAISYLQAAVAEMKTVVIVSHDRNFLNATVGRILHLVDMKIEEYRGNYDAFAEQRAARREAQAKAYKQQQTERMHLQSYVDRYRYSRAAQAQSRIKMLERMELLAPPKADAAIKFSFDSSPANGALVEMEGVSFAYAADGGRGRTVLGDLSLRVGHRARIVVVGENGQGKSTLLRIMAGQLQPCAGKVERHAALRPGYFAQHHVDHLEHGECTLSVLMRSHREDESRRALAAFGLGTNNQQIGTLSGGQKSRMAFAMLSLQRPNLLLLDEPTNHLDMETIDALAAALCSFAGAVVCVSHDLAFVEKVFDEVYVCSDGRLTRFNGSAGDYQQSVAP